MSYEIDAINETKCPCGKGKIKLIFKSNDWNKTKEDVIIDCEECIKNYDIISKHFNPKPKHDYKIYYCRNKNTGEKIKLNL